MQSFQAAPQAQQQPNKHPDPFAPKKPPFLLKLKAHKTPVIIASIGVLILTGMITYLVVSPSQDTRFAPATQEPVTRPLAKRKPTPSPTILPSATPAPTSPTASWQTYINPTYDYSIKYPPDWTVANFGALEPLIPSYVVFNPQTASGSARYISVSISTRSYAAQVALTGTGTATTAAGIVGTKQTFQDSDGNTSTVITLPRSSNLIVLRAKTAYLSIFNQMVATLVSLE